MKNLQELFEQQLKDLYSAENQLIEALPKMVENAENDKLKKAFQEHLEETKNHKTRLQEICSELGISPEGESCDAMKGLIKEADKFIKKNPENDVKDAGIIADAQRVEHYEISGYGTVIRFAKTLGHNAVVDRLVKTLEEEKHADEKLNEIAESGVNAEAR